MSIRQRWIDIVKGIGIILMVIGHADAPRLLKIWIYGFHMPLFFIIAGYTFNRNKWLENGFLPLMQSRAKAYLQPYIGFFIINLIMWSVLVKVSGGEIQLNDWILAGIYSYDIMMPNCAPLWFLPCLFVSYLFFWILIKRDHCIIRASLSIVYLLILLGVCNLEKAYGIIELPWHIDVALISSVFMLIGYELKDKQIIEKVNIPVAVASFLLGSVIIFINGKINMVQNQYNNMVLFIIGASFLTIVFFYISNRISNCKKIKINFMKRCLEFCGKSTLVFIGFNYLFNVIVNQCFKILGIQQRVIYCIVDSIVVIVGCISIELLWNRIKKVIHK